MGSAIENSLEKYNDSNDRQKITLILFGEINKTLIRVVRAISSSNGHLIIIALKGVGVSLINKLATFQANYIYKDIELHANFNTDEWRSEMRRNLIACG